MARPAHVKVFTAEETDRAGDKGHLHAITLRGAAYYPRSLPFCLRSRFSRALQPPPIDKERRPRTAGSVSRGTMPNRERFRLSRRPL